MATTEHPEPARTDIGPKNPAVQIGMDVVDYIDERTGVTTGAKWFMFRNIPRGTSWFQTLGLHRDGGVRHAGDHRDHPGDVLQAGPHDPHSAASSTSPTT